MNTEGIHVGDSGTIIEVTVTDKSGLVIDLSTATVLQLAFYTPNKTTFTRNAVLSGDGSDGKIKYVVAADDFTIPGYHRVQAVVTLPLGTWHSSIQTFEVSENL